MRKRVQTLAKNGQTSSMETDCHSDVASAAEELLFACTIEKQIPRDARNDNSTTDN